MKDYFRPKSWLITALIFIIAFGLSSAMVYYEFILDKNIKAASADAGDNVSGWAWNSNIGWISFNCTADTPACGASDYGVNVEAATGNFSGYAWSSGVGWISFNRCGTDGDCLTSDGDTGNPPGQPYQNGIGNDPIAKYNSGDGKVDGWAKILSLGNSGWIKLRKFSSDSGADYGVTLDPVTDDFSGWAWNGDDSGAGGIGWISFNCANESPACSGTNYKVTGAINSPPTVVNLTAPNWNYTQASADALRANLQFSLVDPDAGSFGSAYQVVVKKKNGGWTLDTGICTGFQTPSLNCKIDNSLCLKNGVTGCVNPGDCTCQFPLGTELDYNTDYQWSVKIWDNYNLASALTDYNTTPDTDNDDGVDITFTTYKHKFPLVSATAFPAEPSQGEEVKLTDASKTFKTATPTTEESCDASKCAWLWTVPLGATINDAATSTPIIVFNTPGANSVKLKVTDLIDGYWTEANISVGVNAKLPKWKEVKPE